MWSDELLHQIKHAAGQQAQEFRAFAYGHVASYDPKTNRARVLFPAFRDQLGNMVLSPWLPCPTMWTGNGFGMQVAPFGGATSENPNRGEQCIVELIERQYGVTAIAHLTFNDSMTPPFPGMLPGEFGMKSKTGSTFYMDAAGNITVTAQANATIQAPNGILRLEGKTVQIHSTEELRYDVNGYGYVLKYDGSQWFTDSWTIGAAAGTTHPITPPEIPE